MKALLIDHDDSFTFNLRDWLKPISSVIEVVNHRDLASVSKKKFDLVVLSPGPKSPQDYPQVLSWVKSLPASQAVFGVCLGMQILAQIENVEICSYAAPFHGKKSKLKILVDNLERFQNLEVARYHSLKCNFNAESPFKVLASTQEDNLPLWIEHLHKKNYGVQFHPESFLTAAPELHLNYLKQWCQI